MDAQVKCYIISQKGVICGEHPKYISTNHLDGYEPPYGNFLEVLHGV